MWHLIASTEAIKGWGIKKNTVNGSVAEQYKFF